MFENLGNFFKRMVKAEQKEIGSKDSAKERLHLVLMQDRANVSADFLELMKQEIIDVIKKYIVIDETSIDVRLTNQSNEDGTNGAPALYANIPIVNIKNDMKVENATEFEEKLVEKVEEKIESKEETDKSIINEETIEPQAEKIEYENKIEEDKEVENLENDNNEIENIDNENNNNNNNNNDSEDSIDDENDDDVTFDDLLKKAEEEDKQEYKHKGKKKKNKSKR